LIKTLLFARCHSKVAIDTGLFTEIRDLFAGAEEARVRDDKADHFIFNVKGDRCEACVNF